MTIEELGQKVKQKYPQYNDMPDFEVGKKVFRKYPQYKSMISTEVVTPKKIGLTDVLKEVPGAIAEVAVGTPAKFLASAAEVPQTILKGKATQKTYDLPLLKPFKSYQSEAETTSGNVVKGKEPLRNVLTPFATVPLAGVETAVLAKGLVKGIGAGKKFITKTGEKMATNNAVKSITPTVKDLTPKQAVEAKKLGKITNRGVVSGEKYKLSSEELRIAKENTDVLRAKTAGENISNVSNRVEELDESVGAYLKQKNQIFSSARLKNKLTEKLGGLGEGIGTNQKSVDDFVNKLINDSNGNLYDAWKARKVFDRYVDDYLRAFSGNPTLKKDIAKATRNGMQEFITNELSDDVYKPTMKKMSDLLKLVDEDDGLLVRKYLGERGLSGLQVLIKKHPTLFRGLKWLGYIGLAGTGYRTFRE